MRAYYEFYIGDTYVICETNNGEIEIKEAYEGKMIEFTNGQGASFLEYPENTSLDIKTLTEDKNFMEEVKEEIVNQEIKAYEARIGV